VGGRVHIGEEGTLRVWRVCVRETPLGPSIWIQICFLGEFVNRLWCSAFLRISVGEGLLQYEVALHWSCDVSRKPCSHCY
jgi:hypothetical protein